MGTVTPLGLIQKEVAEGTGTTLELIQSGAHLLHERGEDFNDAGAATTLKVESFAWDNARRDQASRDIEDEKQATALLEDLSKETSSQSESDAAMAQIMDRLRSKAQNGGTMVDAMQWKGSSQPSSGNPIPAKPTIDPNCVQPDMAPSYVCQNSLMNGCDCKFQDDASGNSVWTGCSSTSWSCSRFNFLCKSLCGKHENVQYCGYCGVDQQVRPPTLPPIPPPFRGLKNMPLGTLSTYGM